MTLGRGYRCLSLPRQGEVQVGGGELLGQQDDLPLMQLQVSSDEVDRFQNGHWPRLAGRLGMNRFQQALWRERTDHCSALRESRGEAGTDLCARLRKRQLELVIPLPYVGLPINAVQEPLPQIPFQMEQEVGNGVFVVGSTVTYLFI